MLGINLHPLYHSHPGFRVNQKQHRIVLGMGGETFAEGFWPKPAQLSNTANGRILLEIQTGMLSPNDLPPSLGAGNFWDARDGDANTYCYQRHACVSCVPYLGTAKLKGGENKMQPHTEQGSQIIWEKNF